MAIQQPTAASQAVVAPKVTEQEQARRYLVTTYLHNADISDVNARYREARMAMERVVEDEMKGLFIADIAEANYTGAKKNQDLRLTVKEDASGIRVSCARVDRFLTDEEKNALNANVTKAMQRYDDNPPLEMNTGHRDAYLQKQYAIYAWGYLTKHMSDACLTHNYDMFKNQRVNPDIVEIMPGRLVAVKVNPEEAERRISGKKDHDAWMASR